MVLGDADQVNRFGPRDVPESLPGHGSNVDVKNIKGVRRKVRVEGETVIEVRLFRGPMQERFGVSSIETMSLWEVPCASSGGPAGIGRLVVGGVCCTTATTRRALGAT